MRMSHAPEIGAENRLHFPGAGFWYVCHTHLGPDLSGTRNRRRIEHCSISQPETGVRVTETMIYHRILFIFVISCKQMTLPLCVNLLFYYF